ncbi:unnamed protein product [Allacma fusca]|uniref:Uncharacterized protein n=1 Tax=Allacma fusca TaxID=39272 RepID=A0A8J2JSX3_9HEXA|nr:unnamed protein product [Allacma fusca]
MDFFTLWIALTAYISLAGFAMFGGLSDIISVVHIGPMCLFQELLDAIRKGIHKGLIEEESATVNKDLSTEEYRIHLKINSIVYCKYLMVSLYWLTFCNDL